MWLNPSTLKIYCNGLGYASFEDLKIIELSLMAILLLLSYFPRQLWEIFGCFW
jgi:hypothetical protein